MPEIVTVADPPESLAVQVADMVALADSYQGCVTTQQARVALGLDLQRNKAAQKTVKDERLKITAPMTKALNAANDLFNRRLLGPLEDAEALMKREALRWDNEQNQKRFHEQREAARIADEEKQRLEAEAKKQTDAGNLETAHALSSAAQMVAPVPTAPAQRAVVGESTRELWTAEVLSVKELCRAVAEDKVAEENVLPNRTSLDRQARALKGSLSIPGVRAKCERILATRASS